MKNLPNLIQIKTLQIQGEKDPKEKQFLFRQLRVLELEKEIQDIRKKIDQLNQLNKVYK